VHLLALKQLGAHGEPIQGNALGECDNVDAAAQFALTSMRLGELEDDLEVTLDPSLHLGSLALTWRTFAV